MEHITTVYSAIYINQGLDDIYFQYNISRLYHASISSFFSPVIGKCEVFFENMM